MSHVPTLVDDRVGIVAFVLLSVSALIARCVQRRIGWWLNVVLFVPAAFGWTLLTSRPVAVSTVLVAGVLIVETLHATVLSGAGDPADVVANGVGIAIGSGVAVAARTMRTP